MKRRRITQETRLKIYNRDGFRCVYCRRTVFVNIPQGHWRQATIDHFISLYLGGKDEINNYVTACFRCNLKKGKGIMEKAVFGREIQEIINDLSKPIADRHLKHRQQGGVDITFIEWHTAVKYLDLYAPGWCYRVNKIHTDSSRIYVVCEITIPAAEGLITREATGSEELNTNSFGDPSSNAESMALKRAAAKFGLGLYLYEKTGQTSSGGYSQPSVGEVSNPIAKSLSELITAKQLGMVRAIAREAGVDPDEECQSVFKCRTDGISRKAASAFIQHLQDLQKSGAVRKAA